MATLAELLVKLGVDSSDFTKGMDKAQGETQSFAGKLASGIGAIGGGIVLGGVAAATAGVAAVGAGLVSSVQAASESEQVQAQLASVLQSTGGAAGLTADQINSMATSLSGMTPFEDDAITKGQNMLLTFTNIGKDVFPMATGTMLDMSQALGQSLSSSAMQLGKALNDPVAGVGALSRVGVTFTDDQKKMIEQMVLTGNTAGAQSVILQELQKEFGGSAEAAGKTMTGSLTILENKMGNVKETIGNAALPAITAFTDALGKLVDDPAFVQVVKDIADALAKVAKIAVENLPGAITSIKNMGAEIKSLYTEWSTKWEGIQQSIKGTIDFISPYVSRFMEEWSTKWEGIQQSTKGTIDFISPYVSGFMEGMSKTINEGLKGISGFWSQYGGDITFVVTTLINTISWIISTGLEAITGFWNAHGDTIKTVVDLIWNSIKTIIGTAFTVIGELFSAFADLFKGDWKGFLDHLGKAWQAVWDGVKSVVGNMWEGMKVVLGDLVNSVFSWWNEQDWGKMGSDIINGVWNGISSMESWLANQMVGFFNNVIGDIKAFLGISSPSKVFADQIGWNLGEGVRVGMMDSLSGLAVAANAELRPVAGEIGQTNAPTYGGGGGQGDQLSMLRELMLMQSRPATAQDIGRAVRDAILAVSG